MSDHANSGIAPDSQPVIKRADAIASGGTRYFTGLPCAHNHVAERMVSTRACVACLKVSKRKWDAENRDKVSTAARESRRRNADAKAKYDRQYRAVNSAKIKNRQADHYSKNRLQVAERGKQYRADNADIHRARSRKWYHENIDRARARNRDHKKKHPEKVNALNANRRARKRGAEGTHTASEVLALLGEQCGICAACKVPLADGYHKDHVVPLIRGGSNWISNIQLLCPPCNLSKGAKLPDEWPAA